MTQMLKDVVTGARTITVPMAEDEVAALTVSRPQVLPRIRLVAVVSEQG